MHLLEVCWALELRLTKKKRSMRRFTVMRAVHVSPSITPQTPHLAASGGSLSMSPCGLLACGAACGQRAAGASATHARGAPSATPLLRSAAAAGSRHAGCCAVHAHIKLPQRGGGRCFAARVALSSLLRGRQLRALASLAVLEEPLAPAAPPVRLAPTLRPYQAENAADILSCIGPGSSRVGLARFEGDARCGLLSFAQRARLLYVLPTGGGKTVVLVDVITKLAAAGKRTLVLVHRKELLEQMAEHLRRAGLEPGIIMSTRKPDPTRVVQARSWRALCEVVP